MSINSVIIKKVDVLCKQDIKQKDILTFLRLDFWDSVPCCLRKQYLKKSDEYDNYVIQKSKKACFIWTYEPSGNHIYLDATIYRLLSIQLQKSSCKVKNR